MRGSVVAAPTGKYNGGMSFYCPWQDGQFETCRRTGGTRCTPGKPGCVLYGKVAFAEDVPERRVKTRARPVTRSIRTTAEMETVANDAPREELVVRFAAFPARLDAAAAGILDWAAERSPGGWTGAQIVHHLADVHAVGLARVRRALSETRPSIEPYDHEAWSRFPDAMDPALVDASLASIRATHARWAALLRALAPESWGRSYRHPDLGRELTVAEDLAWHLEHGETHLRRLR